MKFKATHHGSWCLTAGDFNQTILTLIPKYEDPSTVSQLCPNAICNMSYKILTKILTQCHRQTFRGCVWFAKFWGIGLICRVFDLTRVWTRHNNECGTGNHPKSCTSLNKNSNFIRLFANFSDFSHTSLSRLFTQIATSVLLSANLPGSSLQICQPS